MKYRNKKDRNWVLIFVASILIILGIALVVLAVANITAFGWWSLILGASGVSTIAAAAMSIITNNPSWILLDLIIPG